MRATAGGGILYGSIRREPPQNYTLNLEDVDGIVMLTKVDAGSAPIEYIGSFKFEEETYVIKIKEMDGLIGEYYLGDSGLISSGLHHFTVIDRYIEDTWKEYLARRARGCLNKRTLI